MIDEFFLEGLELPVGSELSEGSETSVGSVSISVVVVAEVSIFVGFFVFLLLLVFSLLLEHPAQEMITAAARTADRIFFIRTSLPTRNPRIDLTFTPDHCFLI